MANKFTAEDIIKKHETNIKSATSGFSLAGILGLAYILRYLITKNFNFHFSLAFTELMLRLGDTGKLPSAAAYVSVALYMLAYVGIIILSAGSSKNIQYALWFYIFDAICLIAVALVHGSALPPEFFIDVIIHAFLLIFLVVGVKSEKALRAE